MDRLLLGVIAVIGLHTAFVLYMANVRRVDENAAMARSAQTQLPARPSQVAVKPPVAEPEILPETPAVENSPPVVTARRDHARSRPLRINSIAGLDAKERTHQRVSRSSRRIPAFPAYAQVRGKSLERSFSDRVIVYEAKVSRPSPALNAVVQSTRDDDTPKPKKSLVAKLQYVYKKPWDLIKAVGSKLR